MTTDPDGVSDTKPSRDRGKLSHPVTKMRLIRELALTDKTQTVLASEYGCTQSSVSEFASRHAARIAEVRSAADDEFAGILYAQKAARVAAYDADADSADTMLDRHRALKSIAEELGHLPNRVTMGGEVATKVTFEVSGLDPTDLK